MSDFRIPNCGKENDPREELKASKEELNKCRRDVTVDDEMAAAHPLPSPALPHLPHPVGEVK